MKPLSGVVLGTNLTISEWNLDAGHGTVAGDFVADGGNLYDHEWLVGNQVMLLFFHGKKIVACGPAVISSLEVHSPVSGIIFIKGKFQGSQQKWVVNG